MGFRAGVYVARDGPVHWSANKSAADDWIGGAIDVRGHRQKAAGQQLQSVLAVADGLARRFNGRRGGGVSFA